MGISRMFAKPRSRMRDLAMLVLFLAVCFAAAGIGGAATAKSVGTWYATLVKPPFNPPNAVFGPVWTLLYLMMAVAGWRVWRAAGFAGAVAAFTAFALQLVLNVCWSLIFFGLQAIGPALVEIVVLLAAIVLTALLFRRHDRLAAWLFVPYIAWVSFATLLNAALWWLNSGPV